VRYHSKSIHRGHTIKESLRGEYAERRKKHDIIFRFSLKMEYNIVLTPNPDWVRSRTARRVHCTTRLEYETEIESGGGALKAICRRQSQHYFRPARNCHVPGPACSATMMLLQLYQQTARCESRLCARQLRGRACTEAPCLRRRSHPREERTDKQHTQRQANKRESRREGSVPLSVCAPVLVQHKPSVL